MRRNLLRLLRNVHSITQATTIEEIDQIQREILDNSEKFDVCFFKLFGYLNSETTVFRILLLLRS